MTRGSTAIDTLAILSVALSRGADELGESLAQLASTYPENWGRPQSRAKAIPRREISIAAQVPTEMRTNGVAVAIAPENVATRQDTREGANVHHVAREQYKPSTPERAMALKLLRSVPLPITTTRVARALQWEREQAKYWVRFFSAKGLLVAKRGGHEWRDGK